MTEWKEKCTQLQRKLKESKDESEAVVKSLQKELRSSENSFKGAQSAIEKLEMDRERTQEKVASLIRDKKGCQDLCEALKQKNAELCAENDKLTELASRKSDHDMSLENLTIGSKSSCVNISYPEQPDVQVVSSTAMATAIESCLMEGKTEHNEGPASAPAMETRCDDNKNVYPDTELMGSVQRKQNVTAENPECRPSANSHKTQKVEKQRWREIDIEYLVGFTLVLCLSSLYLLLQSLHF